jgi:hypothetical protein
MIGGREDGVTRVGGCPRTPRVDPEALLWHPDASIRAAADQLARTRPGSSGDRVADHGSDRRCVRLAGGHPGTRDPRRLRQSTHTTLIAKCLVVLHIRFPSGERPLPGRVRRGPGRTGRLLRHVAVGGDRRVLGLLDLGLSVVGLQDA